MDTEMSIYQKATCEALWRRACEEGLSRSPIYVDTQSPSGKRDLARIVMSLPSDMLIRSTIAEIDAGGPLETGFTIRWAAKYLGPTYRDPSPQSKALYSNPPTYDSQIMQASLETLAACSDELQGESTGDNADEQQAVSLPARPQSPQKKQPPNSSHLTSHTSESSRRL